jgi:hypothetical protein
VRSSFVFEADVRGRRVGEGILRDHEQVVARAHVTRPYASELAVDEGALGAGGE